MTVKNMLLFTVFFFSFRTSTATKLVCVAIVFCYTFDLFVLMVFKIFEF
jgi:hypothetical protein